MRWQMRIGHYKAETTIILLDGRFETPTFVTEEFRERYAYPGLTDEDLFCLVFFDFSRSIKVAYLDEGPLTPQEVHDRGAAVYSRAQEERTRQSRNRGKTRRAMSDYLGFCDDLYRRWYDDHGVVPDGFRFQKEYAPEPYLTFGDEPFPIDGSPALIFLTTNPGRGASLQKKDEPKTLATNDSYASVQKALADRYQIKGCVSVPAATRIKRMHEIAKELRQRKLVTNTGFVQCEVVPFHSETLPGKPKLARLLQATTAGNDLHDYLERLSILLKRSHVVALDATGRLDDQDALWKDWIGMKARLFDFEHAKAGVPPYEKKSENENPSIRFYGYRENGLVRAYNLTDAGNNFGKEVQKMVAAIKDHPAS